MAVMEAVDTRVCKACREAKPLTTDNYYSNGPGANGSERFKWTCITCCRALDVVRRTKRSVEERERRRVLDREKFRAFMASEEGRRKNAERCRRYRQRVAQDPAKVEAQREAMRIRHRLRRERNGKPPLPPVEQVPDAYGLPQIPAQPLAEKMEDLVKRTNAQYAFRDPCHNDGKGGVTEVCQSLGVHERQYTAWKNGEILNVTFDNADRILCRAGWLWWDVYNEETMRTGPITVLLRDLTPTGRWSSVLKKVIYGDPQFRPDWAALAAVEAVFTGEEPPVDISSRELVAA